MSKFKFHVVLPNGDEYLTETLAEARALEAEYARKHRNPHRGPVPRSKLVQNSSAPMSRKERMKPALTDGYKHPPQAWVREILQNSFDNLANRVVFEFGDNDALAIDDGTGMDQHLLLDKFLVPGQSGKLAGSVGGFGEAKKLLTFPWDYFAVVTLTKGGKLQVANGVGSNWDYWEEGKCYDVGYDDGDEPVANSIEPTTPNAKYLPYAELKSIIDRVRKQGHGTATYIRGTETLHDYLHSINSTKVLGGNKGLPSVADATSYVVMCELPDKQIVINGETYSPNVFIPKDAKKFPAAKTYQGGSSMQVYFVEPTDSCATSITVVRAKSRRGTQVMWTETGIVPGTLFIEITGDTKSLLNNTRDSFDYWANEWWSKFKTAFAKDVGSMFLDLTMDEEFVGSGEAMVAQVEEDLAIARNKAWDVRDKFEDSVSHGESKKQIAAELAKAIENAVDQQKGLSRGKEESPISVPAEVTQDMIEDAVKAEATDVQGVTKLALWQPPLRIMNNFSDWTPGAEYMPETMGGPQIRILRAWTEAIRRVLALIGHYDHQFGVGFVFTSDVLALTTGSKLIYGMTSYLINPFVSAKELRSESLFIPARKVSLLPTSSTTIPLDVTNEQHLSVMVSRAVHEITHGVYGVAGHDEDFSSVITNLVAKIGDQYPKIIKAARAGARQPVPKRMTGKAAAKPREEGYVAKRSFREKGQRDPRLPPAGTVLSKKGLHVMTTHDNGVWVFDASGTAAPRGYYKTLSEPVKLHMNGVSTNGYVWFDLTESPARQSKWTYGAYGESGLAAVASARGSYYLSWL